MPLNDLIFAELRRRRVLGLRPADLMPFATPLALLGLLFVPAVVAMYLLRLRRTRDDRPLDPAVAAARRRRRGERAVAAAPAEPAVPPPAPARRRSSRSSPRGRSSSGRRAWPAISSLIVDTSASMAATDVAARPARRGASEAAIEALKDLPAGGKVSVIEAGRTARIVATGTSDLGRVRQAIESIRPTVSRGDLGDALALAQQLAVQSGDAEVLVATDAALAVPPTTKVDAPIRVLRVGDAKGSRNQAIVALAVRTAPSAVTRSVFVSVANLDLESATRRVEVWGDDRLLETRTITIDAQAQGRRRSSTTCRPTSRSLEVRLVAGDGADTSGRPDLLADRRPGVGGRPAGQRTRNILVVGAGDPYLETALSYLPNSRLFGLTPDRVPGGRGPHGRHARGT